MVPSPRDKRFGHRELPRWVKQIRPHQWDAVEEVVEAFEDSDVVFLEAPTGSGKSLIAELVRRELDTRAVYSCTTKALQDQFARNFNYAKVIKGRANYLTQLGVVDEMGRSKKWGRSDITCADCSISEDEEGERRCSWCVEVKGCPYNLARNAAYMGELACVNTSYLLATANSRLNFIRPLMVIDEADTLEDELLRFSELVIRPKWIAKLDLPYPTKRTVESAWVEWAEEAFKRVEDVYDGLEPPEKLTHVSDVRYYNTVSDLYTKLNMLRRELPDGGWIYDGYESRTRARRGTHERGGMVESETGSIIFRPVRVDGWGADLLWSGAEKVLLMSATILSDRLMAEDIGLVGGSKSRRQLKYTMVKVPSTFPVENRPVYFVPVADMAFKNREQGWREMGVGVGGILNRHPKERILVHTVSYDLARYLLTWLEAQGYDSPLFTYDDSESKVEALKRYSATEGAVLLAPSMDRGIDLPDDLCRVQVVAKIPFPNLGDRRVNARLRSIGGRNWYRMHAIRTLVQMTGRGVRSETDHAVTYILDSQFRDNLWENRELFPAWWQQALTTRLQKRHIVQ